MTHNDTRLFVKGPRTTLGWLPSLIFIEPFAAACRLAENRVNVQLSGSLLAILPDRLSRVLIPDKEDVF